MLFTLSILFINCSGKPADESTGTSLVLQTNNLQIISGENDDIVPLCQRSAHLEELLKNTSENTELLQRKILSEKDFTSLTAKEYFIYAMSYPERYYQSCSMYFQEADADQYIHAYLPKQGEGFVISERQRDALVKNRDSVVFYLNQCLSEINSVPLNYKREIILLNAYECIPDLIRIYKAGGYKDYYMLTVFLNLMMDTDFTQFRSTDLYFALYSDFDRDAKISFTESDKNAILDLIDQYHEFKMKSE